MVKQFTKSISSHGFHKLNKEILSHNIDLANKSQKFILPDGGLLYDDPEYKALDESEELHLPYSIIALEYTRNNIPTNQGEEKSSKAILFVRENDDSIVLSPIAWIDRLAVWAPLPEAGIPKIDYLDRSMLPSKGYPAIKLYLANENISISDYANEARVLLCFLNVLHCNNVHIERSESKKSSRLIKPAIKFDAYHFLTIDALKKANKVSDVQTFGNHRSPREHLRRGHIRRLEDGRRIWVKATVVASGSAGVISKDYAFK